MSNLLIKRLTPNARLPKRGSDFAAGYDLFTTDLYELRPGERHLYKTGLAMAIPTGLYGRIAPRSGLAYKHGIDVLAGVIDEDYRDDVGVILINFGDTPWKPDPTKAIAQIIFEYYTTITDFVESDKLPDSNRKGGYGQSDAKTTVGASIGVKQELPNSNGRTNLTQLYKKAGGVPVRTPYSEEMKSQQG